MSPSNTKIPLVCGLTKLNKGGVPLIPLVGFCNSPVSFFLIVDDCLPFFYVDPPYFSILT